MGLQNQKPNIRWILVLVAGIIFLLILVYLVWRYFDYQITELETETDLVFLSTAFFLHKIPHR